MGSGEDLEEEIGGEWGEKGVFGSEERDPVLALEEERRDLGGESSLAEFVAPFEGGREGGETAELTESDEHLTREMKQPSIAQQKENKEVSSSLTFFGVLMYHPLYNEYHAAWLASDMFIVHLNNKLSKIY